MSPRRRAPRLRPWKVIYTDSTTLRRRVKSFRSLVNAAQFADSLRWRSDVVVQNEATGEIANLR